MHHTLHTTVFALTLMGLSEATWAADHAHTTANTVRLDHDHHDSYHRFAPELPATLARIPPLDADTGLFVDEIEPGLFFVTDGIYQSAFLVTDVGVVVFDAPPSFGPRLRAAISTAAPETAITHLIYSHGHTDHVGGAASFADLPGLKVIASDPVAQSLTARAHPGILAPTQTYTDQTNLTIGGHAIELTPATFHAEDQDTIIYLPEQKFLMAIDTITPGEVPFMNFGATADVGAYFAAFDQFLAYDFDYFLSGHLAILGTRDDVIKGRDYSYDVRDTVLAGLAGFDEKFGQAFAAMSYQNANLGYRVAIEDIRDTCSTQMIERWQDQLSVVDVWADSHCEQAVVYYIMH